MIGDQAVDELADLLFAVDTGFRSTRQVTGHLTSTIVGWAVGHGWAARTEARVEVGDDVPFGRLGFVDVLVTIGGGQGGCLAIEIDSAHKPWSLDKLRHAARAGMRPVWVRWGDYEWAGSHADVDVIQIPAPRRPERRTRPGQMQLWAG